MHTLFLETVSTAHFEWFSCPFAMDGLTTGADIVIYQPVYRLCVLSFCFWKFNICRLTYASVFWSHRNGWTDLQTSCAWLSGLVKTLNANIASMSNYIESAILTDWRTSFRKWKDTSFDNLLSKLRTYIQLFILIHWFSFIFLLPFRYSWKLYFIFDVCVKTYLFGKVYYFALQLQ